MKINNFVLANATEAIIGTVNLHTFYFKIIEILSKFKKMVLAHCDSDRDRSV